MNNQSETRLVNSLNRKTIQHSVRRISMRSLLITALILALLSGVAAAAITWGSREYLTYTGEDGQTHANETLIELAQSVSKTFDGTALRIDVADAIFDGRSLVLTWTMQNKQTEGDLYLVLERPQGDEPWLSGQGEQLNVDGVFVHPGETVSSGITTLFEEPVNADSLQIAFAYAVLAPQGEVVSIGGVPDAESPSQAQEEYEAYIRRINELNAQGKLVLAPDGMIELGTNYPENAADMTYAELLVAAGKMALIETVDVSFNIENNSEAKNLLPGGQPIEKDNGDYILRVTKAELSPNTAIFELERVFENREAAERYTPYYTKKAGPYWGFAFQGEDNSRWYFNGGGGGPDAPVAVPDGTWVWAYEYSITQLQSMPKTITIIPLRDNPQTGAFGIPYPEEAIVLQVP